MTEFERIIQLRPAYDKRDSDPSKNYGVHGVDLLFVLKGSKGAVQFLLYTNWHLSRVEEEFMNKYSSYGQFWKPMPADLGYHSLKPLYEGQISYDDCLWLDGKPCYYDGSGLNAERIWKVLLEEGSDGVWRELEEYYKSVFSEEEASS